MDFVIYNGTPAARIIKDAVDIPPSDYAPVLALSASQSEFYAANPGASVEEVLAEALTPPTPEEALSAAKVSKSQEIEAWYNGAISAGYTDQTEGLTMGLEQDRQAQYHRFMDLQKIAIDRGLLAADDPFYIYSKTGEAVVITMPDYENLLLRYGNYYKSIFESYTAVNSQLSAAQTVSDVEAIIIPN
jgi:hypothetical protein